jgi:hypothetical protein
MKKIIITLLVLVFLQIEAKSQNRSLISITIINPKKTYEKSEKLNFNENLTKSSRLLTASGTSALFGVGLTLINIKYQRKEIYGTSLGAYGLSGVLLLASGINLMKATKSKNVQYGFNNSTMSLKIKI